MKGNEKGASIGPSVTGSLLCPALDSIGAPLLLPLLQGFVVTTFGFNHFPGVRILEALQRASTTSTFAIDFLWRSPVWIKNGDDVLQAFSVGAKELIQLAVELGLGLVSRAVDDLFSLLLKILDLSFNRCNLLDFETILYPFLL